MKILPRSLYARFITIVILLLFVHSAVAAFTHYTPFTVQTGQVPSTQTDFPVLLLPTDARFKTTGNGGNVQSLTEPSLPAVNS